MTLARPAGRSLDAKANRFLSLAKELLGFSATRQPPRLLFSHPQGSVCPVATPLIRRASTGGAAKHENGRTTKSAKKTTKTTATMEPAAKRTAKTPAKAKKPKAAAKMSALDAAAKVLADARTRTTTKEMIEAMAAKGYAVASIIGDWENVAMGGYVIETNTDPNDLVRFDQVGMSVVPEPNSAVLCVVGIAPAFGIRLWCRKRRAAVSRRQP